MELAFEVDGSGPVVVLLHGYPLDRRFWKNQVAFLKKSYCVVTIDLRGFGGSPLDAKDTSNNSDSSSSRTYSMARLADDCADLLDFLAITEPVVLGGLSMGGYVAFEFWYRHRERLRALILCDTRAAADTPEGAAARRTIARRALVEGTAAVVAPMIERLVSPQTMLDQAELIYELRDMMFAVPPTTVSAAQHAMAARADFSAHLERIHIPCLALAGADDVISPPAEMKSFASKIPFATYVEIPRAGHLPPIENARAVNEVLMRFLESLNGQASV